MSKSILALVVVLSTAAAQFGVPGANGGTGKLQQLQRTPLQLVDAAVQDMGAAVRSVLGSLQNSINRELTWVRGSVDQLNQQTLHLRQEPVTHVPKDCWEVYRRGDTLPGVYQIQPQGAPKPATVFCEKGWTVIQNRQAGNESFDRPWVDYRDGFGNPASDYWLGLELVHLLTQQSRYKLRLTARRTDSVSDFYLKYEDYAEFKVDDEISNYVMYSATPTGTLGNYLTPVNGVKFSTRDRDHDTTASIHCAARDKGGFWLSSCGSNPNAQKCGNAVCAQWGSYTPTKFRMMLRPFDAKL